MIFNKQKFEELSSIQNTEKPCISIYIPTFRAGHNQEDKLRFKNAVSEAHSKLTEDYEMESKAAHKYLAFAYQLLDNDDFWLRQSDGLAMFIGNGIEEYFTLPEHFHQFVYVGSEFHLSPILPLIIGKDRFFILALSQNEVKFYEGRKHSITPVIIEDLVPENMEMALMEQHEKTLQHHSGGDATIFHGQGGANDSKVMDLIRYFRQIDSGLMEMLHDEDAPMIVACVDYLFPIYKEVNSYSNLQDICISGNPENDDPTVLHEKAWSLLKDHFHTNEHKLKEDFGAFLSEKKASFFMPDIVPAAVNGKVDTLWMVDDYHTYGTYDESTNKVNIDDEKTKNNRCLIDLAAIKTYQNGGKVYRVSREDLPRKTANLNAIYRY